MLHIDHRWEGSRRTAQEYVHESLRHAILRGSITGGTRLVQSGIARQLHVSTTPVREALRGLATEGLIDLDAHRGAVVKRHRLSDFAEIHEFTRLLEPEAVRLAAASLAASGATDHLQRARALSERMLITEDEGEWVDLNRLFHAALLADVPQQRLMTLLHDLRDAAAPYWAMVIHQLELPKELANVQYRRIIEALCDGDTDLAVAIARDHLDLMAHAVERSSEAFDRS